MMKVAAMLIVVVAMAAVAVEEVEAKTSAPPAVDCTSVMLSLSDCLSFVTNGSTINTPEGNCCSGLKTVLKKDAECLCEGFKSSSQFGVVLNITKALGLPAACGVHAPSLSTCGLSLSPTGAPSPAGAVVSPAGAPAGSSIGNAPALSPGGNIVSPALAPSKTGAASAAGVSVQLIVVGLAAAFFSSF